MNRDRSFVYILWGMAVQALVTALLMHTSIAPIDSRQQLFVGLSFIVFILIIAGVQEYIAWINK